MSYLRPVRWRFHACLSIFALFKSSQICKPMMIPISPQRSRPVCKAICFVQCAKCLRSYITLEKKPSRNETCFPACTNKVLCVLLTCRICCLSAWSTGVYAFTSHTSSLPCCVLLSLAEYDACFFGQLLFAEPCAFTCMLTCLPQNAICLSAR